MPDHPTPRAEAEALLAGLEFVSLSFALELLTDEIAARRRVEEGRDRWKAVYSDGVRVALKAGRGIEKAARELDAFDATAIGRAVNESAQDVINEFADEIESLCAQLTAAEERATRAEAALARLRG